MLVSLAGLLPPFASTFCPKVCWPASGLHRESLLLWFSTFWRTCRRKEQGGSERGGKETLGIYMQKQILFQHGCGFDLEQVCENQFLDRTQHGYIPEKRR